MVCHLLPFAKVRQRSRWVNLELSLMVSPLHTMPKALFVAESNINC